MTIQASVVISTYNRLALLQELLDALGRQSLAADAFEVIVVDDGSREPVAPNLAARHDAYRLLVSTQVNAGAAAARDAGISRASGEVIVITDDDMLVPPDFLARHLAAHAAGNTLVLGHIASDGALGAKALFERFHAVQLAKFVERYSQHPSEVRGVMVCTGNVSFRRADYLAVGGFDRSLERSEDRELGVRLQKAGARLFFAKDAVTTNRSDHTELSVWRGRNFNYGVFDSRIHRKHPELVETDPWHFLFLVNPVSRSLLLAAAAAPHLGDRLSGLVYGLSNLLDRHRARHPSLARAAIAGATLSYGLDYFRGVRAEAGSLRQTASAFARHTRAHFGSRARS